MLVEEAQHRVDAHGDRVVVAVIAIADSRRDRVKGDNSGNEVIRRSANALKAVAGSSDRLAHSEGTFLVMANNVSDADLPGHLGIFVDAMAAHGVTGWLGFAVAAPDVTDAQLRAVEQLAS